MIGRAALPALLSVKVCGVLELSTVTPAKSAFAGVNVACGSAAVMPTPAKVDVCVPMESTTARFAEKLPEPDGENVTEMVHDVFAASEELQLFALTAKLPAFAPPRTTDVIGSGALPAFVSVKICAALVVPTVLGPKLTLEGVSEACGVDACVPVQVNPTLCSGRGEG